jgi:selenocysteine lyase/cysteine desulfurase
VRLSHGFFNTVADIEKTLVAIGEIIATEH